MAQGTQQRRSDVVILSLMQPGDFTKNLHRGGVVSVIDSITMSAPSSE
jgi:hypothetical protein